MGLQAGGQATDFVLLVMNGQGTNSIFSNKVKLGADASAAAGPGGRDTSAETDAAMKAEILSYSRAQGWLLAYHWRAQPFDQTTMRTRVSTGSELMPNRSSLGNAQQVPTARTAARKTSATDDAETV